MAAPTFVASYGPGGLANRNGLTPVTASITTAVGDFLALAVMTETDGTNGSFNGTPTGAPSGGTGLTWTRQQQLGVNTGAGAHAIVWLYTATATTAETFTCSVTVTSTCNWTWQAHRYSNHGGYGGSAGTLTGGSAPSLSITTTGARSALSVFAGDWNAIDGTTRTPRAIAGATFTETLYSRVATSVTNYAGYYNDTGTAGAKTVGWTAPTGQAPTIAVVEILASAAPSFSGSLSLAGSGTLSLSGTSVTNGAGSLNLGGSGSLGLTGTAITASGTLARTGSGSLTLSRNPMAAWRAAVSARFTTPATALFIGDSLSEGQGASSKANRWMDVLQNHWRTDFPTPGVTGGAGYLPGWYNVFAPDSTWTHVNASRSGTITDAELNQDGTGTPIPLTNDHTLGQRTEIMSAGATLTYTVTGTSMDIWWVQGFGSFTYKIDAGSAVTVNTAGGTTGRAGRTTGINLGGGSHTVIITATTTVHFGGLYIYNGDEDAGVRVYDATHVGYDTGVFLNNGDVWTLVQPDFVQIALSANDYIYTRYTSAQVKANLKQLIADLRAAITTKPFSVAVTIFDGAFSSGSNPESWTAYKNAVTAVTTEDPSVQLINWGTIGPAASDGAHPNNTGQANIEAVERSALALPAASGSGTVSLSGSGTLSGAGSLTTAGTLARSGSGTLLLSGSVNTPPVGNGTLALTGSGTLTMSGTNVGGVPVVFDTLPLSGSGLLALDGVAFVRTPQLVFIPPFKQRRVPLGNGTALAALLNYGLAVYRIDGQWYESEFPPPSAFELADLFFPGGHIIPVDAATAAILNAAGYETQEVEQ
jgi:hypothetical protein